jgi:hypothetical protein
VLPPSLSKKHVCRLPAQFRLLEQTTGRQVVVHGLHRFGIGLDERDDQCASTQRFNAHRSRARVQI